MISPLSAEKIKQQFGFELADTANITQVAGAKLFVAFLAKSQFKQRLEAGIGRPAAKAFLQIMLGTFVGAASMEAIAEACKDSTIKAYIGSPVCETQIVRILKKLTASQIQWLHDFALGLGLLDIVGGAQTVPMLTFDLDATPVEKYGHQEGVEVGYIGEDEFERCYQYLFIRNDALNTLLYGTIRGGAAHSQNNFCAYLSMILPMFGGRWPLCIRADSAYFNESAFELCCENSAWFFIKAPMLPARQALARSPQLEWQSHPDEEDVEFASYETCTKAGWQWREVFKRVWRPSCAEHPAGHYEYHCIATNDLSRPAFAVFEFYNLRARIENINAELKYDYHLGKVVTQSFAVNDIITQAIVMLFQLVSHFKRYCLDKAHQACRLSTLRDILFCLPGRILSSGRRQWLRLQGLKLDKLVYGRIMARISALKTILVISPMLDSG